MKRWHYTVKKGEIAYSRQSTYKSQRAYERAYYKYICKKGWYNPLVNGARKPMINSNHTGFWMEGYPVFRGWRSDPHKWFSAEGDYGIQEGYKGVREKIWAEMQAEQDRIRRERQEEDERYRQKREKEISMSHYEKATGLYYYNGRNFLGFSESQCWENSEWVEAALLFIANRELINKARKPHRHTTKCNT